MRIVKLFTIDALFEIDGLERSFKVYDSLRSKIIQVKNVKNKVVNQSRNNIMNKS